MLEQLGRFLLRRLRAVLYGHAGRRGRLRSGRGERHHQAQVGRAGRPAAESTRAAEALRDCLDRRPQPGPAGHRQGGRRRRPGRRGRGGDHPAAGRRARPGPGPLPTGPPGLRPQERATAPRPWSFGRITGDEEDLDARAAALTDAYARDDADLQVQVGGQAQVFREVGEQVEADLARAEAIANSITLLLLVLVFASAVAGILPLAVGGSPSSAPCLRQWCRWPRSPTPHLRPQPDHQRSASAWPSTTARSLPPPRSCGPAATPATPWSDHAHCRPHGAVQRRHRDTLLALLVFPLLPALLRLRRHRRGRPGRGRRPVVLPALLAVSGRRSTPVSACPSAVARPLPSNPLPARYEPLTQTGTGPWHRIAGLRSRPVLIVLAVSPSWSCSAPRSWVSASPPDDRVLPASAEGRQVADAIRDNFATDESSALSVVAPASATWWSTWPTRTAAAALSRLDGVERVADALTGAYADAPGPGPAARRRRRHRAGGAALRCRRRHLAVGGAVGRAFFEAGEELGGRGPRCPSSCWAPRSPAPRPSWSNSHQRRRCSGCCRSPVPSSPWSPSCCCS